MRIAVLTEGTSEYRSLSFLYPQLKARTGHVLLKPIKVNVQPDANAAVIAKACKPRVVLANRTADRLVLLLDREKQQTSPGALASAVERAIMNVCGIQVKVVYKDREYENWLVADVQALRAQPGRFSVDDAFERKVEPDRADSANATALLKKAALGASYDKVPDSSRIMPHVSVERASKHSRSFRHFLHVLEDAAYRTQCRTAN